MKPVSQGQGGSDFMPEKYCVLIGLVGWTWLLVSNAQEQRHRQFDCWSKVEIYSIISPTLMFGTPP
jgi:hypothetical protein